MPISYNTLDSTREFVVLPADATVADAYQHLPADAYRRAGTYIVVPDGEAYVIARWSELEEIARLSGWNIVNVPIRRLHELTPRPGYTPEATPTSRAVHAALPDVLARLAPVAPADEIRTTTAEARRLRDRHPGRRLPVTRDGVFVGLIVVELLSADRPESSVLEPLLGSAPVLGESIETWPAPPLEATADAPSEPAAQAPSAPNAEARDPLRLRRIDSLPGLPGPAAPIDINTIDVEQARTMRNAAPGRRLVIVRRAYASIDAFSSPEGRLLALTSQPAASVQRPELRRTMAAALGMSDVKLLCDNLSARIGQRVGVEDLGGETKELIILNLIQYLDRRGLIQALLDELRQERGATSGTPVDDILGLLLGDEPPPDAAPDPFVVSEEVAVGLAGSAEAQYVSQQEILVNAIQTLRASLTSEGSPPRRSNIERRIQTLTEELTGVEARLRELRGPAPALSWRKQLHQIDFAAPLAQIRNLLDSKRGRPLAAMLLAEDCNRFCGDLFAERLADDLSVESADFVRYAITPRDLAHTTLLSDLGAYFGAQQQAETNPDLDLIVEQLVDSLGPASVRLLTLSLVRLVGSVAEQAEIVAWLASRFWPTLLSGLRERAPATRVGLLILVERTGVAERLVRGVLGRASDLDPALVIPLTLTSWSTEDIRSWLMTYTALAQRMSADAIGVEAQRIFREAGSGEPRRVVELLEQLLEPQSEHRNA